ncbi:MAG: UDP-N-acetylglucosamine 2-epimerase (hydrolyzing) [Saprospiraceae bacterium]|nr:UDP-N-acetylglucosamine 2-epimerase (hydrolyzing) [Saprospiraceae bacterium]
MKVVVLTSSRADYGIYRPLLLKMAADESIDLGLIVFGTHLSTFYGETIEDIKSDGFPIVMEIESMILGDSPEAISTAMGTTLLKFASIWSQMAGDLDMVLALGDRYEMFSAIASSIPFGIRIAHLHGGETSLGAIDNVFRHCLTLMAGVHFTATEHYKRKVASLIGTTKNVYCVGALSLDNLQDLSLMDVPSFLTTYGIDLAKPTILSTFHPETIDPDKNTRHARIARNALVDLSENYQIVLTMPNADTAGSTFRRLFMKLKKYPQIHVVESFGALGYLSCMSHCSFLLGNTSSGLIEAPSLGKYAINIGDRQAGRDHSNNVIQVPFDLRKIKAAARKVIELGPYSGINVYASPGRSTANQIIAIIKNLVH